MNFEYAVTPFLAWLIAGTIKFSINSIKSGRLAFGQIGYGGLPSNHSAIVSSAAALVAFREGINEPAFGIAIALAFVVILDANSLRKQVGLHAEAINRLNSETRKKPLRERMGHTRIEILAGTLVGICTAWIVNIYCVFM